MSTEVNTITELENWIQDLALKSAKDQTIQLSSLRARRNELASPLCRTPFEVLQRILHRLVESHYRLPWELFVTTEGLNLPDNMCTFTAIFAVCTHIRLVALASPVLWSYIQINMGPKWTELCLERAKSFNLVVLQYSAPDAGYTVLQDEEQDAVILHALSPRTRELHLDGLRLNAKEHLPFSPLQIHWPNLRCLSWNRGCGSAVELDSHFLGGQTSLLTSLSLRSVPLSEVVVFPALIYLCLRDVNVQHGLSDVLRTLEQAPLLEYLYLDDVRVRMYGRTSEESSQKIVLPYLSALILVGGVVEVATLLRVLPTPLIKIWISVKTNVWDAEKPIENALQEEVIQRMHQITGEDPIPDLYHGRSKKWELSLKYSRPSGWSATYINACNRPDGYLPLLNTFRQIRLLKTGRPIIAAALKNLGAWFLQLERLSVLQAGIEQLRLQDWLRARVANGSRLKCLVVRMMGKIQTTEFAEVKDEIIREGLVDILCTERPDTIWKRIAD
jgi:hypothetical protein